MSARGDVHQLRIRVGARERQRVIAALFEAGAGGIEERDDDLIVYASSKRELTKLRRRVEQVAESARCEESRLSAAAWQDPWLEHLGPERVSPGFALVPRGMQAPRGVHALVFEPELVFGVGSHPTTRLAAEAVERHCRAHPGLSVLDVGTGTGVLAMIAVSVGAKQALGIDVDPRAVRAARKNARLNQLTACHFSPRPLAELQRSYDLVVANVEAPVLLELSRDLVRVTRKQLLVTGVLAERAGEVAAALETAGARSEGSHTAEGWSLLELRAPNQ